MFQDRSRLYYNKSELQQFEDIECEWPLFLCMFLLDAMYNKRTDDVEFYWQQLEKVFLAFIYKIFKNIFYPFSSTL